MKPVHWIGSSREDLRRFPRQVRRDMGFMLESAQKGDKPPSARPLHGFKGARVLELVENHRGDTYRVIYTVRFPEAVYVLHAFKKKSKRGISTPKQDLELIQARLKRSKEDYEQWLREGKP